MHYSHTIQMKRLYFIFHVLFIAFIPQVRSQIKIYDNLTKFDRVFLAMGSLDGDFID